MGDSKDAEQTAPSELQAYLSFIYGSFLKPHDGDKNGDQQEALESFYKTQAHAYDTTRTRLLRGREEMVHLVAAQLKQKEYVRKPVWVDIGGGTGWNIERMGNYLSIPEFFRAVYLVDFTPSLCEVARARFKRLGWTNVTVVCQDARYFRLEDHEDPSDSSDDNVKGADLITMSYSLTMIPEYYPIIDSLVSLLSVNGIIGVVDFYTQNLVEYRGRNYIGGDLGRHCNWLNRTFWRIWFDLDRVHLDPARRDYLEYRFGTKLNINARNIMVWGTRIPHYIWIGCSKDSPSIDEQLTGLGITGTSSNANDKPSDSLGTDSKVYTAATANLAGKLPLPSSFYQNHRWRMYYDDQLSKYKQFGDQYTCAFPWEDSLLDTRILQIQPDDVILTLTGAGDNIFSFILENPKRIYAVDRNPAQNHLLELKIAAFLGLDYLVVWKLFGEGKHEDFRTLLIEKLSPHMSSQAFQFWWNYGPGIFTGQGLFYSSSSPHVPNLVKWFLSLTGMTAAGKKLAAAHTLDEQKQIWDHSVRPVLLNRLLHSTVVGNQRRPWKLLSVPKQQSAIIEKDLTSQGDKEASSENYAVWKYAVKTLDPLVDSTLLSENSHYYLPFLQGKYNDHCHPDYLKSNNHVKLSQSSVFDKLQIHTDEIDEVIAQMSPGTLTIAIVMDSMDQLDPEGTEAETLIRALNTALVISGKVLLKSVGLKPWYISKFEEFGFESERHGSREPVACIDQ